MRSLVEVAGPTAPVKTALLESAGIFGNDRPVGARAAADRFLS